MRMSPVERAFVKELQYDDGITHKLLDVGFVDEWIEVDDEVQNQN